jgi:DNA-binding XRE family transcriptional regulator
MALKTNKRAKTQTAVMNWVEEQLDQDSSLRQQVEELLNQMRVEQDLLALRLEKGLSQRQLARTLGVSQPAIAKIESGKVRNLELRTLVRYATALGGTVKIEVRRGKTR